MVLFVLWVSAELENVAELKPEPDCQWCLDLKQSDGEEEKKEVYISVDEEVEMEGSKGVANFVMKWPDTRRQASVVITDVKKLTRAITGEDSGSLVPVIAFECRGCDPVKWHPGGGWRVAHARGKVFEDVDLSDDFCDIDEKSNEPCSVMELKWEFRTHRG